LRPQRQRRRQFQSAASRQRQVRHQLQSIARLDDLAAHGCQPVGLELRPGRKKLGELFGPALVDVVGSGHLGRARGHDPAVVVERAVGDADLARQLAVQELEIVGNALVERDPVERQVLRSDRLDHARARIGDHAADIRLGMLGEHALPGARPVHADQRRLVAADG
jgi:hypothetical protein